MIKESMKMPPPYERWTDEDEQRLIALQSNRIGIEDTMFGHEVVLKKRELEAVAGHFSREERAALIRKFDAMDAAESAAIDAALQASADPLPIVPGKLQGEVQAD